MELIKDEMYGKELGKYTILERILTKDSHKRYIVKCNKCGEVIDKGMELRLAERTAFNDKCIHPNISPESRVGKTYGKYHLLEFVGYKEGTTTPKYKIKCNKCGFEGVMDLQSIKQSSIDSECIHMGIWSSKRLERIYRDMIRRCYDPSRQNYRSYGAKGIDVCEEWRNNPWEFNRWSIENGYRDDLSIDRINPNRGYYPDNCQWVPLDYNRKWNSYSQYIVVNGVKDTQAGWCRNLGLYDTALHYYMQTHSYEETALYISQLQHPDKTVICVEVDSELFESRDKKESIKYDK